VQADTDGIEFSSLCCRLVVKLHGYKKVVECKKDLWKSIRKNLLNKKENVKK